MIDIFIDAAFTCVGIIARDSGDFPLEDGSRFLYFKSSTGNIMDWYIPVTYDIVWSGGGH